MTACSIKVTNQINKTVWGKQFETEEEYHRVKDLTQQRDSVNLISSLVFPTRTNNWSNFSKDLFLPTTVNYASKTDNIAQKIIEHIVFTLLDVITLPIRLVTCIPRSIYNATKEEHVFAKYLKTQAHVGRQLLKADRLLVEFQGEFSEGSQYTTTSSLGSRGFVVKSERLDGYIHLIEVPKPLESQGLSGTQLGFR